MTTTLLIIIAIQFILLATITAANYIIRTRVTTFKRKYFNYMTDECIDHESYKIVEKVTELINNELPDNLNE